jgi:hypothetical protein
MCASSLGEYRTQRGRVYLSGIRFGGPSVPVLLGEGGGRERGVSVTDGEMAIKLITEYQFLSRASRLGSPPCLTTEFIRAEPRLNPIDSAHTNMGSGAC